MGGLYCKKDPEAWYSENLINKSESVSVCLSVCMSVCMYKINSLTP
jgi:hypothetical protein